MPHLPPSSTTPGPAYSCSLMTAENRRAGSVSFCSFSFLPHLCVTRLLPFQSLLFLCVPKLSGLLLPPWRAWLQASRAGDGLRGWGCSGGGGELAWALRLSCGLALNLASPPTLSSTWLFGKVPAKPTITLCDGPSCKWPAGSSEGSGGGAGWVIMRFLPRGCAG